jgi:murein DD-endopeptidase MepM/ murein hydrolase activator NlpD
MSWIKPFPDKKITGHYGTMSEYRKKNGLQAHSGTDWAMPGGTPIPAIARGTITGVYESKILGHVIEQRAMDKDGKLWYIGYCHLQKPPTLKVGDKVQAGDTVGLVGTTGSASSGNHLHATASRRQKGVFGVTADKVDLLKLIEENSAK